MGSGAVPLEALTEVEAEDSEVAPLPASTEVEVEDLIEEGGEGEDPGKPL